MVRPHSWLECRPAVIDLKGRRATADSIKLEMAWSLVPDIDRRLFHDFCCLNRHNVETLAAAHRIAEILGPANDD